MTKPKQMGLPMQLLGVATKSSATTVLKSSVVTMAKEVGTRPKSAGLEAPVQQEMQEAGTLGCMLRMTGESGASLGPKTTDGQNAGGGSPVIERKGAGTDPGGSGR